MKPAILNFFLSGTLFLFNNGLAAQDSTAPAVQVSFRVSAFNNILIPAVLNQQDSLVLMFHTAASDVMLTETTVKRLHRLQVDGKVDSVQSWGGANGAARFSRNNRIRIGPREWSGITIWEDQYSGQESDGKFGPGLFEGQVLLLDFDKSLLTVQDQLPEKMDGFVSFPLTVKDGLFFITASCIIGKDTLSHSFLIHSGYAGSLLLDDAFAALPQVKGNIPVTGEKKLTDAYGNVVLTKKGLLPGFMLGNTGFQAVPVGFFEGTIGRQQMSIMGGELIRRFNWVIDLRQANAWLRPNARNREPFRVF